MFAKDFDFAAHIQEHYEVIRSRPPTWSGRGYSWRRKSTGEMVVKWSTQYIIIQRRLIAHIKKELGLISLCPVPSTKKHVGKKARWTAEKKARNFLPVVDSLTKRISTDAPLIKLRSVRRFGTWPDFWYA